MDKSLTLVIEDIVEQELNALLQEAKIGVDIFWSFRMTEEDTKHKNERSKLAVRTRLYKGSLCIEWSWIRWKYIHGKPKPEYVYISKGTKEKYSMTKLLAYARWWEKDLVKELEEDFADIRKRAKILGKLRLYARKLQRESEKGEFEDTAPLELVDE